MKFLLMLFLVLIFKSSFSQNEPIEKDTLQKRENVMLSLDNGFAINPFSVSGDLYLTGHSVIFHPKKYRGKRFDMYNQVVKDVIIPYDSIKQAKRRGIFNLKLKTKDKKYKISFSNSWGKNLRATVTQINQIVSNRRK